MDISDKTKQLIFQAESYLKIKAVKIVTPPQGMGSEVIFLVDENGREYVIKSSEDATVDIEAYRLIEQNKLKIPVPKMLGHFVCNGKPVIILEKVKFPLLESIPVNKMHKYIPSMLLNLREMHKLLSPRAGYLSDKDEKRMWKKIFISKFSGEDEYLKWQDISKRDGLNEKLVRSSVDHFLEKIIELDLLDHDYSLLHTDFNQRNLFVNPNSFEIAGIIDWAEAMFGDPIYDFARVRMYIWHFDLGNDVIDSYYSQMKYSSYERMLDDIYWLSRVIEYLAYYSEVLNEFNIGRIKLHQSFLENFNWEGI